MTAVYPGSLPVKEAAGALLSTNPHSQLHDDMYDEIVAIATELGTNPSGSYGTVADRFAADGALTSYIPAGVSQNGLHAITTVESKYFIDQRGMVTWFFDLEVDADGSAGTALTLALPYVSSIVGGVTGAGMITSDGTAQVGVWNGYSTSTVGFRTHGQPNWWGVTPPTAIGINDRIRGCITYPGGSIPPGP